MTLELCENCGSEIKMMVQHMTGFCSQLCEETYEAPPDFLADPK